MQGLIPQAFINELLTRIDIVEFIDNHVPLKKRGNSYLACCPFHTEKTPSFNVIPRKQFYHCFGCGASGNVISFAMNFLKQSFPEAIANLAARCGLEIPREANGATLSNERNLQQLLQKVNIFYQTSLRQSAAISYLKQRGVNGDTARLYQLGYAPAGWHILETQFRRDKTELLKTGMVIQKDDGNTYDRYRDRLMFPIHDRHGRLIGFGGRALQPDQQPKYLNSPETVLFQKHRELYGLHQVLQHGAHHPQMLIVEGYLDVLALAQHGIPYVVATLGTATSVQHIQLLSKHTSCLIFCFDGDNAGRQAAWRALENSLSLLNSGLEAKFMFLPEGHDPDSLVRHEGGDAFVTRMANATPVHQFFIANLLQDIDPRTLSGKSQLVQAVKPYLAKMSDGPYKQLMLNELARLTHLDPHRLLQLIQTPSDTTPDDKISRQNIRRSPMRLALALLIQHPEIYIEISQSLQPEQVDKHNYELLYKLMQHLAKHPTINTAALIEAWRDTDWFDVMNKLAAWEHYVPDHALAKEFLDIFHFLHKQTRENEIQSLLNKARQYDLTSDERHHLQRLLKQRHESSI